MSLWMCVLLGIIAATIDWSGVGPNSARDRVAAIGYLASALGWSQQLGIDRWEVEMLGTLSHDWRILWSMVGVAVTGFWIGAMVPALPILGRFGQLSFRGRGRSSVGRPGGASGAAAAGGALPSASRINGKLLSWTIGVAAATPLAMPSVYEKLLSSINGSASHAAMAIGTAIGKFFGWS
jgi:hypothetical protein